MVDIWLVSEDFLLWPDWLAVPVLVWVVWVVWVVLVSFGYFLVL